MGKKTNFIKNCLFVCGLGLIFLGLGGSDYIRAGATTGFRRYVPLGQGVYSCQSYAWSDYSPTNSYKAVLNGIDAEVTRTYQQYYGPRVTIKNMSVSPVHSLWSPSAWIMW